MDAFVVIDMQEGSLVNSDKYDVPGVVGRINLIAGKIRAKGGRVIFIQQDGTEEESLAPGSSGWEVLSSLHQEPDDLHISKTTNDSFYGTELEECLKQLNVARLIICGWATDQCVDSTIRAAISRDYEVVVAADCHTVSDRTIPAQQVITHHNGIWAHLLTPGKPIKVIPAKEVIRSLA